MSYYSEQALQEKLNRLSTSQDSIETLSTWIVHHRAHASTSISIWLDNYVEGDADRRLLLFYLANDVLQNSRRKGGEVFMELFRAPLEQAATMASGLKIQTSVERIFRIWKERHIFEHSFLKQLQGAIEPSLVAAGHDKRHTPQTKGKMEFKLPLLEDALLEMQKFEGEMKVKSTLLSNLRIDVSDTACFSQLKDKSAGDKFKTEFEEASQKLQEFSQCLNIEANERRNIVEMLHLCKSYQEEKMAELNSLLQDYSQLQIHLESLKGKLKERVEDLERAQHTATSDPTSKDDITLAGDMEIDSDNEAQPEGAPVAMETKSSDPQGAIPVTGVSLPPMLQPPPSSGSSCPFLVPSPSPQPSFIPPFAPPLGNQPPLLPPLQPQFLARPLFPIPPNLSPSLLGRPPLGVLHSHAQPLPSPPIANLPPGSTTLGGVTSLPLSTLPSLTRPITPHVPPISQPVFQPLPVAVRTSLVSPHLPPSSLASDMPPPASRAAHVDLGMPSPVSAGGKYSFEQTVTNSTGISQESDPQSLQQKLQLNKDEEEIESPTVTQKLFPKSLLQDYYSDSESEEGDNDGSQPYSPSQVLVISSPTHEQELSESPPSSTQLATPVSTPLVVNSASPAYLSNSVTSAGKAFPSASIASSLELILGSVARTSVVSHQPNLHEELNRLPASDDRVSKDSIKQQQPSVQGCSQFSSSQGSAIGQQIQAPFIGSHALPCSTAANTPASEEPKWFNPDAFAETRVPPSHGFHLSPSPSDTVSTTTPSQQPSSLPPPSSIAGITSVDVVDSSLPVSPARVERTKINPENIKITPSLTNLLDNLFPKLSKSLEERKRKGREDESNLDVASKAPRVDSTAVSIKTSSSNDVESPTLVSVSLTPSQLEHSIHNAVASPIPTIGSYPPTQTVEFHHNSTHSSGNFNSCRPISSVPPLMSGFRPDLSSPGPRLGGPLPEFPPSSSGINFPFRASLPGPCGPQTQFSPVPRPDFSMASQLNNSPFPRKPFELFPSPYRPGLNPQSMRALNFNTRPPPPHLRLPGRFRPPSQRPRYF